MKGMPAEITGPRQHPLGVKTSVLIKRDQMRRVRRAKDMAAVSTVVTTQEQPKRRATGRRVAVGRCSVGFPVVFGGEARNRAQVFILHPFVFGQFADTVGTLNVSCRGGSSQPW